MSLKILYVEDDAGSRRLIYLMVERVGHQLHSVQDAEAGIQAARELSPDVILMDINLPGMNGDEACRLIKEDPDLGPIPVIALTANNMDGDRNYLLSQGFSGYLAKPFTRLEFFNMIQRVVQDDED